MGEEFWGKGTNIQEGPGINIARVMRNGRNFEYISGEDPVLGSVMLSHLKLYKSTKPPKHLFNDARNPH